MALEPRPIIDQRGLALPAIRTAGGYFASRGPHDVAWGDLLLALFTRLGSRFMERDLGSTLQDFLFRPQANKNVPLIEDTVRDLAERDVPQIVLETVAVTFVQSTLTLKIAFHLVDDTTVVERFVRLDRSNLIRIIAAERLK